MDNDNRELAAADFYGLGINETAFISAYHNYGIYDLLERIVELLPQRELADLWEDAPDGEVAAEDDWWEDDGDEEDGSRRSFGLRLWS